MTLAMDAHEIADEDLAAVARRCRHRAAAAPAALATAEAAARRVHDRRGLSVLAHEDGSGVEHGVVEGLDGARGVVGVGKGHEAAPLRPPVRSDHHVRMQHLAHRAEVVLQILPRRLPREVAHVDLGAALRRADALSSSPPDRHHRPEPRPRTCAHTAPTRARLE